MRPRHAILLASSLVGLVAWACGDDTGGRDASRAEGIWLPLDGSRDRPPGESGGADRGGDGKRCTDVVAFSCGDSRSWCDFGTCKPCAAGQLNCNGTSACECAGSCDGTGCRGTVACDYYDQNVCAGDTTKFCFENKCVSCTGGWSNCDGTKGCECSKGCNGKACL